MDKKQNKILSKSFVSNQRMNSSSFTKLPDGSVKRKRQKASYKDIYLEKQNFIPTQMPLSKQRNGNYSTLYHNNTVINISHDNSNYSFKTEDNDDSINNKKSQIKNFSDKLQSKHVKTKSLNINTSNSIYQFITPKNNPESLKPNLVNKRKNLSVKNQTRAGINLLNISNRSQNTNQSINKNNGNEKNDIAETFDNDNLNILQSREVTKFQEKTYFHSFNCPKNVSENDFMIQFLNEKEGKKEIIKTKMIKSFELEGINIKSAYVYFGGIKCLNGLLESIKPKKDFGIIEEVNPSKLNSKLIKQNQCNSNNFLDYLISGSLIENDKVGDFEQFQVLTNNLEEAISKQNNLKENNSFEKINENNDYYCKFVKMTGTFEKEEEKEEEKMKCLVIKDKLLLKNNNLQLNTVMNSLNQQDFDMYESENLNSLNKNSNINQFYTYNKDINEKKFTSTSYYIDEKNDEITKEISNNTQNRENRNQNQDYQLEEANNTDCMKDGIMNTMLNNPRLIDISPDKKQNNEETNSSFNKEAETEYHNPESTNSKTTPVDREKQKINLYKENNHEYNTIKKINNIDRYNNEDNYNQDNSYNNNIYKKTDNEVKMFIDKDIVQTQIEEINKINESLKSIQETIENSKRTINKANKENENKTQYENDIKEDDTFNEEEKQIHSLISEFKKNCFLKEDKLKSMHNNDKTINQLQVSEGKNDDFIIVENAMVTNTINPLRNNQLSNDMLMSCSQNIISKINNEEIENESQSQDDEEKCTEKLMPSTQNFDKHLSFSYNEQKEPISVSCDRLTTEQRDEENNMEISLSISQSDHENENYNEFNNEKDNGFYPSPDKIVTTNSNCESVTMIREPRSFSNGSDLENSPTKSNKLSQRNKMIQDEKELFQSPNETNLNNENQSKVLGFKKQIDNYQDDHAIEKNYDDNDNIYRNYYYKHKDEIEEVEEECEESFKRSLGNNNFTYNKKQWNYTVQAVSDNFNTEDNNNNYTNNKKNSNEIIIQKEVNLNKKISQFEISTICLAINNIKSQTLQKSSPKITLTQEESFNVVGKSLKPIINETKVFSIENLSFHIKQIISTKNNNSNSLNIQSQQDTVNHIFDENKNRDLQRINKEDEYKIYTSNKLQLLKKKSEGALNNSTNLEKPIDNVVNNQIDNFINLLKVKNKTKEDNLSSILNEKENELKYLKERQEYIIKQKQLNHEKKINSINHEEKEINLNNSQNHANDRNCNECCLRKLVNKEPVILNDSSTIQQESNQLAIIKKPDALNQNRVTKTTPIVEEIIHKKEVLYTKSHKSIFQNEQQDINTNTNTNTPLNKIEFKSGQKVNMNDLMLLGEDSQLNKVSSFFDFEGFNSNSKRDREITIKDKDKKIIEKSLFLNKVKEDLKQTEHTKKGKEDNKFNLMTHSNKNKYVQTHNIIMPANKLKMF